MIRVAVGLVALGATLLGVALATASTVVLYLSCAASVAALLTLGGAVVRSRRRVGDPVEGAR